MGHPILIFNQNSHDFVEFSGFDVMPRTLFAGARLVDMVVPPRALVESGGKLRLHALYYITKQIVPALERVLTLVGADPRAWFVGMTKPQRLLPQKRPPNALPLPHQGRSNANAGTIDQYYLSRHCAVSPHASYSPSLSLQSRRICSSGRTAGLQGLGFVDLLFLGLVDLLNQMDHPQRFCGDLNVCGSAVEFS